MDYAVTEFLRPVGDPVTGCAVPQAEGKEFPTFEEAAAHHDAVVARGGTARLSIRLAAGWVTVREP